jgi:hypothetical protein
MLFAASIRCVAIPLRDEKQANTLNMGKSPNIIDKYKRFLGSVRRECLDHILILHEKQLHRVLHAYVKYFNEARPHQGIHQQVPQGKVPSIPPDQCGDRIISVPVLGGLHHEYRKVA